MRDLAEDRDLLARAYFPGIDPAQLTDDLIRAGGAGAIRAVLDQAQPLVDLLWRRETEGRVFDSPERRAALDKALAYVQERKAFGKPIGKFQNTQFKLAECATQVEVGRAFMDRLLAEHVAGEYLVKECSMAKLWQTEMLGKVVDECLQFFGGYGYMLEYPISRAFMDARVQRIYAGTNEIMKVIIAKQLGL